MQPHSQAGATEKEEKAEELSASVRFQCRDLSMFDDFGSHRILSGTSLSKSATGEAWGHKALVKLCLATAKRLRLLTKARAQAKANDIKFVGTPGPQIYKEREGA